MSTDARVLGQLACMSVLLCSICLAQTATGIEDFNRGDYKAARQHLTAASSDPRARAFLILTRAATGECDSVVPELERQFSSKGDERVRRLSGIALAQCRMAAKQFDAAGPVVFQLEREFPSDPDVLYVAANYHMKAWNDAIYRMYQKAPSSYRVDELSAEVFETQGKYTEAIAEYRKAIAKNPKGINLHYRLGRALLQQSHDPAVLEEARREFEAELALNPSDAVAEYQVAQILNTEQKKTEAAAHFERAAELRPDFAEALVAVAKIRSDAKQYDEAARLLERAVKLQPRSEIAHYNLMLAYRRAGRTADAQREKAELDKLQKPPEGEFTDFLKRLGEKAPPQ
ncbi:MAG TPA: tetratricopeptide repeat protein [Bryobacteraceae bacterium]|nr:tetratricopeptide repeat protein [Bryobacteraceae bacterium]